MSSGHPRLPFWAHCLGKCLLLRSTTYSGSESLGVVLILQALVEAHSRFAHCLILLMCLVLILVL